MDNKDPKLLLVSVGTSIVGWMNKVKELSQEDRSFMETLQDSTDRRSSERILDDMKRKYSAQFQHIIDLLESPFRGEVSTTAELDTIMELEHRWDRVLGEGDQVVMLTSDTAIGIACADILTHVLKRSRDGRRWMGLI